MNQPRRNIEDSLLNKQTRCSWAVTFISLVYHSTCFGRFLHPSSGVYNCMCSPWYECTSGNHLPTWQDICLERTVYKSLPSCIVLVYLILISDARYHEPKNYGNVFISYIGNWIRLTWQVMSCMYLVSSRARYTVVQTLPSSAAQTTRLITSHAEYSLHMLRKDCIQPRTTTGFNVLHLITTA